MSPLSHVTFDLQTHSSGPPTRDRPVLTPTEGELLRREDAAGGGEEREEEGDQADDRGGDVPAKEKGGRGRGARAHPVRFLLSSEQYISNVARASKRP